MGSKLWCGEHMVSLPRVQGVKGVRRAASWGVNLLEFVCSGKEGREREGREEERMNRRK